MSIAKQDRNLAPDGIPQLRQLFGLNDRQARFALAKGMGATNRAAAKEAGYGAKDDNSLDANSSALVRNHKVSAAISHVFAQHAQELREELHIDKTKILSDLEVLKAKSMQNQQYGPAVRATELQGRAVGIRFGRNMEVHPIDSIPTEELIEAIAQDDEVLAEKLREKLGWAKLSTD